MSGALTARASKPTVAMQLVLWYQRLFAGRPSPCRFSPSCSAYALEALEIHGTARGLLLTLRRLSRCRPFGPSGWDPVPEIGSPRYAVHDHASHRGDMHDDTCVASSGTGPPTSNVSTVAEKGC